MSFKKVFMQPKWYISIGRCEKSGDLSLGNWPISCYKLKDKYEVQIFNHPSIPSFGYTT
jgi:hypothetical protein